MLSPCIICWDFVLCLCHSCYEFIHASALACPETTVSFQFCTTWSSSIPSGPFWQRSLRLGKVCDINVPFRAKPSSATYYFHVDQLRVCVLIATYCKQKHLWWGLRDALMYGYNPKSLGVVLKVYPLSRITVLGSLLWSTTYLFSPKWCQ